MHPEYQAKIADLIIQTVNQAKERGIDIRLIIETHSEAMINRFGKRVVRGENKLDHRDIGIYLFEKKLNDLESKVRFCSYSQEGYLEHWPYGFFMPGGN